MYILSFFLISKCAEISVKYRLSNMIEVGNVYGGQVYGASDLVILLWWQKEFAKGFYKKVPSATQSKAASETNCLMRN